MFLFIIRRLVIFASITIWIPLIMSNMPVYNSVIFAGNSLTRHPPRPDIFWFNDWGMAATTQANDFVHIATGIIAANNATNNTGTPTVSMAHIDVPWTTEYAAYNTTEATVQPDLTILQMGDNYPFVDSQATFDTEYTQLLETAIANSRQVVAVGLWGGNDWRNTHMRSIALAHNVQYVEIYDLNVAPNRGLDDGVFTDGEVNWHPGNRGMNLIAQRIASTLGANITITPTGITGSIGGHCKC